LYNVKVGRQQQQTGSWNAGTCCSSMLHVASSLGWVRTCTYTLRWLRSGRLDTWGPVTKVGLSPVLKMYRLLSLGTSQYPKNVKQLCVNKNGLKCL